MPWVAPLDHFGGLQRPWIARPTFETLICRLFCDGSGSRRRRRKVYRLTLSAVDESTGTTPHPHLCDVMQQADCQHEPQALERLGVADIGYITVCLGLPIPPISREHGVRLKGLA
jgi:hypothetical protein